MSTRSFAHVARLLALAVVLACQNSWPAAAQSKAYVEPANMRDLVAAAAKEGTLNVAWGAVFGGADGARVIQDHINKQYHINLQIHYSPISGGVQFVQQLIQEVKAGQPASSDIVFSVYANTVVPYVQRVDYRKYLPGLPENVMVYDMHAVAASTALGAFDYNTKLIPPNEVPKSFADLLKPQFKGRLASSPYQGSFLNYIGLPEVFGHQGMLDYTNKFASQIGGLMVCGEIDRVVSGEFLIFGVDCGDYEVRKRQRKHEPIAAMYPREGTNVTYVAPGIPLTSAHPNAARLFIAYLLTPDGQNVLWDVAAADSDRIPGSHMTKVVGDLKHQGVKFVDGMARDLTHPELDGYEKEISKIINAGK
jgi:ABC-type Fe3+ transport system substrate-binding protein